MTQHLSKREFDALKHLSQNKHIFQKSVKGISIVIVDRKKCIKKIENFLHDQSKFQKTAVNNYDFLNFIISQEKHIDKFYKNLVDSYSMSEETQRSETWNHGIMYGSCKVHQKCVDGCPTFRPILSALRTPIYKLRKFWCLF